MACGAVREPVETRAGTMLRHEDAVRRNAFMTDDTLHRNPAGVTLTWLYSCPGGTSLDVEALPDRCPICFRGGVGRIRAPPHTVASGVRA